MHFKKHEDCRLLLIDAIIPEIPSTIYIVIANF